MVYTQKRASSYIKVNKVMDLSCFGKMDATEDNINQIKSISKKSCFLSYVVSRFYINMQNHICTYNIYKIKVNLPKESKKTKSL